MQKRLLIVSLFILFIIAFVSGCSQYFGQEARGVDVQGQQVTPRSSSADDALLRKMDADGDGIIGQGDFMLFNETFNSGTYDEKFDYDNNGAVDFDDFFKLQEYWGTEVSQQPDMVQEPSETSTIREPTFQEPTFADIDGPFIYDPVDIQEGEELISNALTNPAEKSKLKQRQGLALMDISEIAADPGADFNRDGKIDFDDFFLFEKVFDKDATGDNSKFDLSENKKVDFDDFFIFADNFGKKIDIPLKPNPYLDEVVPGHNDPYDSNRINIVLFGVNTNLNLQQKSMDFIGEDSGELFSYEPFKSNKNKFNIWYAKEKLFLSDGGLFSDPNKEKVRSNLQFIGFINKHRLPKFYPVIIEDEVYFRSYAIDDYAFVYGGEGPFAFVHEFGHSFGKLGDEYFDATANLAPAGSINCQPYDTKSEPEVCSRWCRGTSLESTKCPQDFMECMKERGSCSWVYSDKGIQGGKCVNSAIFCRSFKDQPSCESAGGQGQKACIWGIKDSGVIKCISYKESYYSTLTPFTDVGSNCIEDSGCYRECDRNNKLFRSSLTSIMRSPIAKEFNYIGKLAICKRIENEAGSAGGVCTSLKHKVVDDKNHVIRPVDKPFIFDVQVKPAQKNMPILIEAFTLFSDEITFFYRFEGETDFQFAGMKKKDKNKYFIDLDNKKNAKFLEYYLSASQGKEITIYPPDGEEDPVKVLIEPSLIVLPADSRIEVIKHNFPDEGVVEYMLVNRQDPGRYHVGDIYYKGKLVNLFPASNEKRDMALSFSQADFPASNGGVVLRYQEEANRELKIFYPAIDAKKSKKELFVVLDGSTYWKKNDDLKIDNPLFEDALRNGDLAMAAPS